MSNVRSNNRTTRVVCRASKYSPRITMDLKNGAYKVEPRVEAEAPETKPERPVLRLVKAATSKKSQKKDIHQNTEKLDQKISRLLKEARADLDLIADRQHKRLAGIAGY